ncbi:MAG: hypothetical protein GX915_10450 [Clostridiales bacterium]|nr:hypothetical protein [Clostridiales bacterium]
MGHFILCLFAVLFITVEPANIQVDDSNDKISRSIQTEELDNDQNHDISEDIDYIMEDEGIIDPLEALDMVKKIYAANFEKVYEETEDYYYKLPDFNYYLVLEDYDDIESYYLIHLYEFVIDELDTAIGHTVTYGWYKVYRDTGQITEHVY